ncbi:chromate transporter [Sporolactobacillus sp. THM19-2]|uniref:chromate transporter n=1 Tax=Sporolactobacillus sp. THM19-2 TaxID=2511171 RepID=UPI00101EBD5F|nr:chromate transporter [Sporolactobacillus sp. THM19-2]RYL94210.1 chromate transporter [Sporolactobacillus sp. THM19-2]
MHKRGSASTRYTDIFIAFFRSSILSFGGGPSGIPLIEAEVVKKYKWMTLEEFGDLVAIANALPGPINTKLAGYVGWKLKKFGGLLTALIAVVLPTVLLLTGLLSFLSAFRDQRWVRGMTEAVLPVVGVLMAQLTWRFFFSAKKGLGWLISLILIAVSFVLMEVLHIHPAILIALTLLVVLIKPQKKQAGGGSK